MKLLTSVLLASLTVGDGPIEFKSGLLCETAQQVMRVLIMNPQSDEDFFNDAELVNQKEPERVCYYAEEQIWHIAPTRDRPNDRHRVIEVRFFGYKSPNDGYQRIEQRSIMFYYPRRLGGAAVSP